MGQDEASVSCLVDRVEIQQPSGEVDLARRLVGRLEEASKCCRDLLLQGSPLFDDPFVPESGQERALVDVDSAPVVTSLQRAEKPVDVHLDLLGPESSPTLVDLEPSVGRKPASKFVEHLPEVRLGLSVGRIGPEPIGQRRPVDRPTSPKRQRRQQQPGAWAGLAIDPLTIRPDLEVPEDPNLMSESSGPPRHGVGPAGLAEAWHPIAHR